jgi:hypothetical protein
MQQLHKSEQTLEMARPFANVIYKKRNAQQKNAIQPRALPSQARG